MALTIEDVLKIAKERLAVGDSAGAWSLYRQILDRAPMNEVALSGAMQAATASGDRARIAEAQRRSALALTEAARAHYRNALQALQQADALASRAAAADASLGEAVTLAWRIGHFFARSPQYFSQFGQDQYLNDRVFRGARDGVFVDVGAYDGITGSNTLFFEKFLGWRGLCIEADPAQFAKLAQVRSCPCAQICIADKNGTAEFLSVSAGLDMIGGLVAHYDPDALKKAHANPGAKTIVLPTRRLDTVLAEQGVDRIDYLSIDVEGAELPILKSFDLARYAVRALSVENNSADNAIAEHLQRAGYRKLIRLGVDDLFVRA
jgi:FkbM family methyltransferase